MAVMVLMLYRNWQWMMALTYQSGPPIAKCVSSRKVTPPAYRSVSHSAYFYIVTRPAPQTRFFPAKKTAIGKQR